MTTTNFLPDSTSVHCMGSNHRDSARRGTCRSCGADVVKTDKGRVLELNIRYNAADRLVEDFACWGDAHTCDPARIEAWARATQRSLDAGDLIIGQHVTITRGRKIAKGTTGIVRWVGDSSFGPRVGLDIEGQPERVFIAALNVTATNQLEREAHTVNLMCTKCGTPGVVHHYDCTIVDEKPAEAVKPSTPRASGSHKDCSHEATKSERAKCRTARKG